MDNNGADTKAVSNYNIRLHSINAKTINTPRLPTLWSNMWQILNQLCSPK